ncbi:cation-translocating P-type ATPase C-terminal domain-containing protein [Actinomyces culturomici]|uniref:cation-translocating P-type ATPase C-terminal domain-containing protein n=1 Tax=Actinomyces culturomici TaxID=1926276 RepID=UPI002E25E747
MPASPCRSSRCRSCGSISSPTRRPRSRWASIRRRRTSWPAHPGGCGDRIVDRAMWARILVIGAVMGLVSLAVLDLLLPEGLLPSSLAPGGTTDLRTARTAAFTTLVLAQLFNALNSRSDLRSAFVGIFDNRWLWGAIGIGVIAQIAVVHLQILQAAFATSSLSAAQWAVCAGAASLVLWIEEAVKAVRRAVRRSAR